MPLQSELATFFSLASLGLLCVLVLRRLVLADRLHELRVVLLTALLWLAALYLFSLAFAPPTDDYVCPEPDGDRRPFCITEM